MKSLFEYLVESSESSAKTAKFIKCVKAAGLDNDVKLSCTRTRPTVYQLHVYTDDEKVLKWVDKTMNSIFGFSTNKTIKELQAEFKQMKDLSPWDGVILFAQFTSWDLTWNLKNMQEIQKRPS